MGAWRTIRVVGLVLFCFFVGGALVLGPLTDPKQRENPAAVSFGDIYPGLAALAVGLVVGGYMWYFSRGEGPPKE